MESPAKKARTTSTDNKRLSVDVEIGGSDGRGHGLFARKKLPAGWMFHDHPICIPCPSDAARRQLPTFDFIDELMQTIMETAATGNERFSDLIDGEWKMTHLRRHLDMQDDDVELPAWAVQLGVLQGRRSQLIGKPVPVVQGHQSEALASHDGPQSSQKSLCASSYAIVFESHVSLLM